MCRTYGDYRVDKNIREVRSLLRIARRTEVRFTDNDYLQRRQCPTVPLQLYGEMEIDLEMDFSPYTLHHQQLNASDRFDGFARKNNTPLVTPIKTDLFKKKAANNMTWNEDVTWECRRIVFEIPPYHPKPKAQSKVANKLKEFAAACKAQDACMHEIELFSSNRESTFGHLYTSQCSKDLFNFNNDDLKKISKINLSYLHSPCMNNEYLFIDFINHIPHKRNVLSKKCNLNEYFRLNYIFIFLDLHSSV